MGPHGSCTSSLMGLSAAAAARRSSFGQNFRKCDHCGHSPLQHYCWWNRKIANPIKFNGYVGKGCDAMLILKNEVPQPPSPTRFAPNAPPRWRRRRRREHASQYCSTPRAGAGQDAASPHQGAVRGQPFAPSAPGADPYLDWFRGALCAYRCCPSPTATSPIASWWSPPSCRPCEHASYAPRGSAR
jgi:hypothetical protein